MRFSRLYWSVFINSFGSWLTFLGVALYVNEKYGSHQVAFVFLIQTLPSILLARGACQAIPERYQQKVYIWLQFALAANCLILSLFPALPIIYAHLFFASIFKSLSNPTFSTLLGRWIAKEKIHEVSIRIGALQTSTLALAPVAGAWIKIISNVQILFFLDGLTFLVSLWLLKNYFADSNQDETSSSKVSFKFKSMLSTSFTIPKNLPTPLLPKLLIWFSFLGVGALLNAIEFPTFERFGMSETQIGYALAGWGLGSLMGFLKKSNFSMRAFGFVFCLSILSFIFSQNWIFAIASFTIGGWSSTLLSGKVIGEIQTAVPENYNALPIWAFANQIVQLINLVAYAGVGLLLRSFGFSFFALTISIILFIMQSLVWLDGRRKVAIDGHLYQTGRAKN